MRKIYNELRSHEGKLTEFANFLVEKGLFSHYKHASQALRINTKTNPDIVKLYEEWKPGKLKTKDLSSNSQKLKAVFIDIRAKSLKTQLEYVQDVMEEALKELTLGLKNMDRERLLQAKELLSNGLYGGNTDED